MNNDDTLVPLEPESDNPPMVGSPSVELLSERSSSSTGATSTVDVQRSSVTSSTTAALSPTAASLFA